MQPLTATPLTRWFYVGMSGMSSIAIRGPFFCATDQPYLSMYAQTSSITVVIFFSDTLSFTKMIHFSSMAGLELLS